MDSVRYTVDSRILKLYFENKRCVVSSVNVIFHISRRIPFVMEKGKLGMFGGGMWLSKRLSSNSFFLNAGSTLKAQN